MIAAEDAAVAPLLAMLLATITLIAAACFLFATLLRYIADFSLMLPLLLSLMLLMPLSPLRFLLF